VFLALPLEEKIALIKGKMEESKQVYLEAKMDHEAALEQYNENVDRHAAAEKERLTAEFEALARRELLKKSIEEHKSKLKLDQARLDKVKKEIAEALLKKQKLEQKLARVELALKCTKLKIKYVKLSRRRRSWV
jgi:hypothetical protein